MTKKYLILAIILIAAGIAIIFTRDSGPIEKSEENQNEIPFTFFIPPDIDFPDRICNIVDFGAIAEDQNSNTRAINDAINSCAGKGGGTVLVPEGIWPVGAIKLQSNIKLDLAEGSELRFSHEPKDYLPVVFSRFEGIELMNYSPLIRAADCQNVAITGKGTLNGQGEDWWRWKEWQDRGAEKLYEMGKKNIPVSERVFGNERDGLRPSFVEFVNCQNIRLQDFTIIDGPMWTIHPLYSKNITIDGIIVSTKDGPNTDGIVIDSSENVLIENSNLSAGDDAIAIKSGQDEDGWRVDRPSKNIVIRNIIASEGHSGIAIGSEMSGGVRNVFATDLKFTSTDQGFRIKSIAGRGGTVENIWVKNFQTEEIENAAFQIDLQYGSSTVESENKTLPTIKNVHVSGLQTKKPKYAIRIEGLKKSPTQEIEIENISGDTEKGMLLSNIDGINISGINLTTTRQNKLYNTTNVENIAIEDDSPWSKLKSLFGSLSSK